MSANREDLPFERRSLMTSYRSVRHDDFTRNRDARGRNAAEMHPRDDFDCKQPHPDRSSFEPPVELGLMRDLPSQFRSQRKEYGK
jgi:hypothetical protein